MNETAKQTLGSIMGVDLAGFQLTRAFWLELDHTLMGTFPALVAETNEPVVCLDRELLGRIKDMLPQRRSKEVGTFALANVEQESAFNIEGRLDHGTAPLILITQAKFDELCAASDQPFKWAPGLVGNDMTEEEFRETLATAQADGPT